ncbi:hypothetical protein NLJ89_g4039 [Agrocybe chaxingu]|uniref:DUF726-domain-containing protein n=1 Tax=Agrocybe chaxingu TaxID=84603 RepID=A0A9W8K430_9AGAR|nr:hypothetical protein NLJ89_g4039 [Agrocybe chaxingu]
MPPVTTFPPHKDVFDDDDDDGWQDMPIIREDTSLSGMDEEDQKRYHYQPSAKGKTAANATGNLIDVDDQGHEWRSKIEQNESDYTRLRGTEEADVDEVHLRTRYLFDEDKAMTPLSQMQATKNLLTEAQRIAYELKHSITNMELWALKIMGRLYYHMELETQEQKMIESLAEHGVLASDLVPALMTTHTVANPEYDPEEARRKAEDVLHHDDSDDESISDQTLVNEPLPKASSPPHKDQEEERTSTSSVKQVPTTTKVLKDSETAAIPGVSTSLSSTDENVTLDIRWTVLCDLFLVLIADSVYDARSRVLLEQVAFKMGLGWLDVVKFESRVTEALEIQEDVETLEQQELVEGARKAGKKRRYMMLGLATIGGGLVIGLSAGLMAPVIGLGLAGALTTVGVSGTAAFLGGTAGAAVITTGGVLTGSSIAVRGMVKRTQQVRTFEILPLHNNKRVNCILTVPGFMNGVNDDVRLPFSVLDPIVGDVFSVLWEPEMIRETGTALSILTGEVLSQIGMTVLQATVMTGLMTALQWPIILTKLGYLIDNPWSNALDRAKGAGKVLADVLINRHLGVRPITLIGFSLGARVIFYALLELAKQKQFGIVQDVFLLGATLTVSQSLWCDSRSVVSGRYVNAFARNDWVLNYLFRATSGGVGTVAGLRPVEGVPGLENVDVTDKIAGHMSYRTFMPLILDQLGFPEPDFTEDRIVVREEEEKKKSGWFSRKKSNTTPQKHVSRPPSTATFANFKKNDLPSANGSPLKGPPATAPADDADDDLPPRLGTPTGSAHASPKVTPLSLPGSGRNTPTPSRPSTPSSSSSHLPLRAGFDLAAIKNALNEVEHGVDTPSTAKLPSHLAPPPIAPPSMRSQSTPPTQVQGASSHPRASSLDLEYGFVTAPTYSVEERGPKTVGISPREDGVPSFGRSFSDFSSASSSSLHPSTSGFVRPSSFDDEYAARPMATTTSFSALPDDVIPSWDASTVNLSPATESPATARPFNTFNTLPSIPSPPNPFAIPATSMVMPPSIPISSQFASTPGLSFGDANGSVTSSTVVGRAPQWSIPPLGDPRKKTAIDGFNANPWS